MHSTRLPMISARNSVKGRRSRKIKTKPPPSNKKPTLSPQLRARYRKANFRTKRRDSHVDRTTVKSHYLWGGISPICDHGTGVLRIPYTVRRDHNGIIRTYLASSAPGFLSASPNLTGVRAATNAVKLPPHTAAHSSRTRIRQCRSAFSKRPRPSPTHSLYFCHAKPALLETVSVHGWSRATLWSPLQPLPLIHSTLPAARPMDPGYSPQDGQPLSQTPIVLTVWAC
jgi:hypothetical protein